MACPSWFLLAFLLSFCLLLKDAHRFCNGDPTEGFTAVPLTEWNFEMEKPYDIPLEERYSFLDGVRRMWVYSSDKPLRPDSKTKPRTEIRIRGRFFGCILGRIARVGSCTRVGNRLRTVRCTPPVCVAVGAGWQWLVAYINLGCYYVVGIPIGYLLAFNFDLGVKGMWTGMLSGVALQTLILIGITLGTDWNKEAKEADSRIKKWGGSVIDEK